MIKELYEKYKNLIPYIVFGILTTIVNTLVYWLCAHPLGLDVIPSSIIAWFVAVLFAYVTNRRWVFYSEASTLKEIVREIVYFYLCRITTGFVDWLCMYIFVDILGLNDLIIKVGANVLVIILNYIASMLIVFKKRAEQVE